MNLLMLQMQPSWVSGIYNFYISYRAEIWKVFFIILLLANYIAQKRKFKAIKVQDKERRIEVEKV